MTATASPQTSPTPTAGPSIGNRVSADDDAVSAPAAPANGKADVKVTDLIPKPPAAEPEPKPEKPKSKGTEFVDLPPEVSARFKRIYGNMKGYERQIGMLAQQNQKLEAELTRLKSEASSKAQGEQVQALKGKLKTAMTTGDYDQMAEVTEEIAEIKAEQKKQAALAEAKPKPQAPQPQSALSKEEVDSVAAWQGEKDDSGKPLRPWAVKGHPKHATAVRLIQTVAEDPDFADEPIEKILAEVDRMMGVQKAAPVAEPEAEEEAPAPKRSIAPPTGRAEMKPQREVPTRLSNDAMRIAEKMFMGTPLAKTREEAHKLYARQRGLTTRIVAEED